LLTSSDHQLHFGESFIGNGSEVHKIRRFKVRIPNHNCKFKRDLWSIFTKHICFKTRYLDITITLSQILLIIKFYKIVDYEIQFLKPVPTCLVWDICIRNVSSAFWTEFKLDRSGEADPIKNLRFEGRIRRLRNRCMKSTSQGENAKMSIYV
jgi:hypothetical protein